ncbi:MAG: hypothetical protein K2X82_17850 [Gemmataceae bacterium]|nr:hypothetical protein [Gemmataceae bacterium]
MQPSDGRNESPLNQTVRVETAPGRARPERLVEVATPLDELSVAGSLAELDRHESSPGYAAPAGFAREVLGRLGEALARIEVSAGLLRMTVASAGEAESCRIALSLALEGNSPTSIGGLLDEADAHFAKFQARAELLAAAVLDDLAGDGLMGIPAADRGAVIARLRHTLLQSNCRVVCPHCASPSLPYFLPHTAEGTVQLQHKQTNPVAHAVFGSRVGTDFPRLQLARLSGETAAESGG